ncbi:hypothetical protein FRB91_000661 [Serendipita sp. 411]|nr:hypothetical protein FRB91_000661 [Serendipita sp. 411]
MTTTTMASTGTGTGTTGRLRQLAATHSLTRSLTHYRGGRVDCPWCKYTLLDSIAIVVRLSFLHPRFILETPTRALASSTTEHNRERTEYQYEELAHMSLQN